MCAVFNVSEGEKDDSSALPHPETETAVPTKWSAAGEAESGRHTGLIFLLNFTAESRINMATS